MAALLQEVDARVRTKAHLLGHSFGGLLALSYAVKWPERVASIVLLDPDPATHAEWIRHREVVETRLSAEDRRFLATAPRGSEAFLRRYLATYFGDRALAERLELTGLDEAATRAVRADLGEWDIRADLARIAAPTLIVQGGASIFRREAGEEIQRAIGRSELHVLEGVGHFPHLEAPDDLERLVREFLSSRTA